MLLKTLLLAVCVLCALFGLLQCTLVLCVYFPRFWTHWEFFAGWILFIPLGLYGLFWLLIRDRS